MRGTGWGPRSGARVGAGAVLPLMCTGSAPPMGAEVAWLWAVGTWVGASGVLGHPVVGAEWDGLFALGVSAPPKDLPSKTALWATMDPLPWAVLSPLNTRIPALGPCSGVALLVPLLALELIWAGSLPGQAPAAALPGGGQLSMETAV